MRKIVIDTNVVVSAAIANGYSARVIHAISTDSSLISCLSQEVLKEYKNVAEYNRIQKKYSWYREKVLEIISVLEDVSDSYQPTTLFQIIKDIEDNVFLDLAFECKADYLITGNYKHFTINEFEGTRIVSPKLFCELYDQNNL